MLGFWLTKRTLTHAYKNKSATRNSTWHFSVSGSWLRLPFAAAMPVHRLSGDSSRNDAEVVGDDGGSASYNDLFSLST